MNFFSGKIPKFIKNSEFFLPLKKKKIKDMNEIYCLAEIGKMSFGLFHDIMSPISSLILFLDLIEKDRRIKKGLREQLKPAIESSRTIADFIRIIQKDLNNSAKEKIRINKIVCRVMKLVSHKALQQNVAIVFIRKKRIYLETQRVKIYQILINIISNSIDSFSGMPNKRKRQISISTDEDKRYIILKIKDNGCGIKEDKLNKIFIDGYTTKESGHGFGLGNIKRIIEKDLKGKIEFNSVMGTGTLCTVTLPKNH